MGGSYHTTDSPLTYNPIAPAGQAVRFMLWLGLESWSTRPTGQVVRVMVWLGLESWSDTYTLFPRSHHTLSIHRLGSVRLGLG